MSHVIKFNCTAGSALHCCAGAVLPTGPARHGQVTFTLRCDPARRVTQYVFEPLLPSPASVPPFKTIRADSCDETS